MFTSLQKLPYVGELTRHIPPSQFARYLAVGTSNTVIGYSSYAVLTAVLTPHLPHAYVVAGALSGVINITVAFLSYKWFVFKTAGNYWREWLRCLLVYGVGIAVTTALLPPTVFLLRRLVHLTGSAPYVAGALLLGANVIFSFLGHKKFSFAAAAKSAPDLRKSASDLPAGGD